MDDDVMLREYVLKYETEMREPYRQKRRDTEKALGEEVNYWWIESRHF